MLTSKNNETNEVITCFYLIPTFVRKKIKTLTNYFKTLLLPRLTFYILETRN